MEIVKNNEDEEYEYASITTQPNPSRFLSLCE
jgi:hypothetical protein